MIRPIHSNLIFCLAFAILFSACKDSFDVKEFDPLINYSLKKNDSLYTINADLSNASLYGIEIPSLRQLSNGKFAFSFKLNNNNKPQQFFYKLYYQNESNKWNEGDSLDYENFYGSWEEAQLEFKPTPIIDGEIIITDSFKIIGNPRDEEMYYGANPEDVRLSKDKLDFFKTFIPSQPEWMKSVKEKAKFNHITEDEQAYFEAVWAIDYGFQNDSVFNNREKRNPRMGRYKFMLIVCNGNGLSQIPDEVRNIHKKNNNGNFSNPFTFFAKNKNIPGTEILISQKQLEVISKLNPGSGIFIDRFKINKTGLSTSCYNANCGESEKLRHSAHFGQYFHHINKNWEFTNVKEIKDVVSEHFTRAQYHAMISEYAISKNFAHVYANITNCPCSTIGSDSITKTASIFNPGNKNGEYKKEMSGIMSRIGFTYGKWTAKIKFPKIISEDNVWNGLTSAFWLIFQSDAKWNMRRSCQADIAYIPKSEPDTPESVKLSKKRIAYSEIDFEILKESQYWTQSAYGGRADYPKEDAASNNDIIICCTNWDMACQQPTDFSFGAKKINVEGHENIFNRWDYFSKLITSKVSVSHKEVFNDDFYYFEIDWQPQRIIWRIGKDKNQLREICRMDATMTSIPNNQMVMVMSQEFHYQEWWPTAPFLQNYIPFPKNDLVGKLLEIEIH